MGLEIVLKLTRYLLEILSQRQIKHNLMLTHFTVNIIHQKVYNVYKLRYNMDVPMLGKKKRLPPIESLRVVY